MDRSRFPEKYKTLTIVIPPVEKKGCCCLNPKHLYCCMPGRIPHGK